MTTDAPIRVGDLLPAMTVEHVRADDIAKIALILHDPNPIHFDVGAVVASGLGDRLVNQGGSTMAYVINLVTSWAGSRSALRSIRCSFTGNVFAGDDVVVGGTVTSVEDDGTQILIGCEIWAEVVGGRRAILGEATVSRAKDANHG